MKTQTIYTGDSDTLLLLFAGWGMDATPFGNLRVEGYDVMVAWDYTDKDMTGLLKQVACYKEICVVAWSFGVAAASNFIASGDGRLPVTLTIAVNGTMYPVDDERGIPLAIFNGTRDNLDERNLGKFYRRMCGSGQAYKDFCAMMPDRSIESLVAELEAIEHLPIDRSARWDIVYISEDDAIIPVANQRRGWEGYHVTSIKGPHLPPFEKIFNENLVDKGLVKQRFGRSISTYQKSADVQERIADNLVSKFRDRLGAKGQNISDVDLLEIGCGTGLLTCRYTAAGMPRRLMLCDLVDTDVIEDIPHEKRIGDAEKIIRQIPDGSVDFILSASTVQWFNSLPAFLHQCDRVLRRGGTFIFSTFGPSTFSSLRSLTGAALRHYTLEEVLAMLPDGMKATEVDEEVVTLRFRSALEMMRHLQATGVTGVKGGDRVGAVKRVLRDYPVEADGSCELKYNPQYFIIEKV